MCRWIYYFDLFKMIHSFESITLVFARRSDSHGINFSCCSSVAESWSLSRKSFYFVVILFLLSSVLLPDQPRVSLARMEKPALLDPLALLYVPSFHASHPIQALTLKCPHHFHSVSSFSSLILMKNPSKWNLKQRISNANCVVAYNLSLFVFNVINSNISIKQRHCLCWFKVLERC